LAFKKGKALIKDQPRRNPRLPGGERNWAKGEPRWEKTLAKGKRRERKNKGRHPGPKLVKGKRLKRTERRGVRLESKGRRTRKRKEGGTQTSFYQKRKEGVPKRERGTWGQSEASRVATEKKTSFSKKDLGIQYPPQGWDLKVQNRGRGAQQGEKTAGVHLGAGKQKRRRFVEKKGGDGVAPIL